MINAIARSRTSPEDAEHILDRMSDANIKPDVVCYNAVINAYGWSDFVGKEQRAYAVFNRMMASYRAGTADAKPDIITCNSILNACAFAVGGDRAAVIKVAILHARNVPVGSSRIWISKPHNIWQHANLHQSSNAPVRKAMRFSGGDLLAVLRRRTCFGPRYPFAESCRDADSVENNTRPSFDSQ